MITLLLVDDDPQVLAGLRMRIFLEDDLTVLGEARDAAHGLQLAQRWHPDVVVMDVSLPGHDGIEAIHKFSGISPCPATIVLTMFDDLATRARAAASGAAAFVGKHQPVDVLLAAIRSVGAIERAPYDEQENQS